MVLQKKRVKRAAGDGDKTMVRNDRSRNNPTEAAAVQKMRLLFPRMQLCQKHRHV